MGNLDVKEARVVRFVGEAEIKVVGVCFALERQEVEGVEDIESESTGGPNVGGRQQSRT